MLEIVKHKHMLAGIRFDQFPESLDLAVMNDARGRLDILLAHPASAAYGLNLQDGGSHVAWFGLNWSLELFQHSHLRPSCTSQSLLSKPPKAPSGSHLSAQGSV